MGLKLCCFYTFIGLMLHYLQTMHEAEERSKTLSHIRDDREYFTTIMAEQINRKIK